MPTKRERLSLTDNGVFVLETLTNYHVNNLVYLSKILDSYFDSNCDLDGDETCQENARELVRNSDKIRALVYTIGDLICNVSDTLDDVIEELYAPETLKDIYSQLYEDMQKEREEIDKAMADINAKIAEDFTSRG